MPSKERVRHDRMMLRHSQSVKAESERIYPLIESVLQKASITNRASCTAGELQAAVRYLASSLAEYCLRKKSGIRDSKFDPEDEALWREDRALKGDWVAVTGSPNGSLAQETMKKTMGEPCTKKIERARAIRAEAKLSLGWTPPTNGGARYAVANAIRHAWLICHNNDGPISYGRRKNVDDPAGPLFDFISAVLQVIPVHVSKDEIHKDVRAIDKRLYS